MKCIFCGSEIPEDEKKCPVCGKEIPDADTEKQSKNDSADDNKEPPANPYEYGIPGTDGDNNPYDSFRYWDNNDQKNEDDDGHRINGSRYFKLALLVTLFGSFPFGVVALINAMKIGALQRRGDYAGARRAAKKVKLYSVIGAVVGVVSTVYYISLFKRSGMDLQSFLNQDLSTILSQPYAEDGGDADGKDTEKSVDPAKQEQKSGETWETSTVQVGDVILTFPCTLQDVEKTGLILDESETVEKVAAKSYEYLYFQDKNQNRVLMYAVNTTGKEVKTEECLVGGISVSQYDLENGGLKIEFPGDITLGSKKETVLQTYGKTKDKYEGDSRQTYSWFDKDLKYKSCSVDFDTETGLVFAIDMKNFGY